MNAHALKKFWLATFICTIVVSENDFALTTGFAQVRANSSNQLKTLSDAVAFMTQPTRNDVLGNGAGWSVWKSETVLWKYVVATAPDSNAKTANLLAAMKDGKPVSMLASAQNGKRYQYFKGRLVSLGNLNITAWATQESGLVDRVMIRTTNGKQVISGDLDGNGISDYCATPVEGTRWAVLLFDKATNKPRATLIYDAARADYVAASDYALKISRMSNAYLRSDDGNWVEYVFDGKQGKTTAVAVHGSAPGLLKQAVFDVTGDGFADAFVKKDEKENSFQVESPKQKVAMETLNATNFAEMMIAVASEATARWHESSKLIRASEALGYVFPAVLVLPKK